MKSPLVVPHYIAVAADIGGHNVKPFSRNRHICIGHILYQSERFVIRSHLQTECNNFASLGAVTCTQ
jgi:hypothetical protein